MGKPGPVFSNGLESQLSVTLATVERPQLVVGGDFSLSVPEGVGDVHEGGDVAGVELLGNVHLALTSEGAPAGFVESADDLRAGEWQFLLADFGTLDADPDAPRLTTESLLASYGGQIVDMPGLGTQAVLFEGDEPRLGLAWVDAIKSVHHIAFFIAPADTDGDTLLSVIDTLHTTK